MSEEENSVQERSDEILIFDGNDKKWIHDSNQIKMAVARGGHITIPITYSNNLEFLMRKQLFYTCGKATILADLKMIFFFYSNKVDGGWSLWSNFTRCSRTCDVGTKKRVRTCTNPKPKNDGKSCEGNPIEVEQCFDIECPGLSK